MFVRLIVGNETTVKWFLEHGADPNLCGSIKASPLATAALTHSTAVLDLLISYGAQLDPNALFKAMNPRGDGGLEIMQHLIDRGIDINAVDVKLGTPLHYAVRLGSIVKIEMLLKSGADRTIKFYNKTPIESAKERGDMDVAEALL